MTTITQRQARVSAYFDHITDDAPRQFKDIGKVQQQVQKPAIANCVMICKSPSAVQV